jgi:hypothetical protein
MPFPFPFDPLPAPFPQPPVIPTLSLLPPVSGYNVTVKVWPLGFRDITPEQDEAVQSAIAEVKKSGADRISALNNLMKVLSNDKRK